MYTELSTPDDSVLEGKLHGRYCGTSIDDVPHMFVSVRQVLVVILYTDSSLTYSGFNATFNFIDACE